MEFFYYAREKENEGDLKKAWLSLYPLMMTEQIKFITFDEFKNKTKTTDCKMSNQEIIDEMSIIANMCRKKV